MPREGYPRIVSFGSCLARCDINSLMVLGEGNGGDIGGVGILLFVTESEDNYETAVGEMTSWIPFPQWMLSSCCQCLASWQAFCFSKEEEGDDR